MKAVLLGATSGMGRELARLMSQRGDRLFLLGRDVGQLERSARDLEIRSGRKLGQGVVGTAQCDLLQAETLDVALDVADKALDGFDTVIVTAGLFGTQQQLEEDPEFASRVVLANFAHTVVFCENARKRLLSRGGGTLCVFSSVAGERGRKPVILYGSTKAGLSHYLEGLDHKFRSAGLKTVCVKPGFVKTGMTAGLKPPPFAGTASDVARRVLQAIDRGWPEVYVPSAWRWVMCVIRRLPRFVMRRIEF